MSAERDAAVAALGAVLHRLNPLLYGTSGKGTSKWSIDDAAAILDALSADDARAIARALVPSIGWDAAMQDPNVVAGLDEGIADIVAGRVTPYVPSLDAAWAAVEAVLPEGWRLYGLHRMDAAWGARTTRELPHKHPRGVWTTGPTPVAALLALAEKLRERQG